LRSHESILRSAERKAQEAGKSLASVILEFLAGFSAKEDDFERLAKEEQFLRSKLQQPGRSFSAGDRLDRDSLHDRDALS